MAVNIQIGLVRPMAFDIAITVAALFVPETIDIS